MTPPRKKSHVLTDLEVSEVSLCTAPSNPGAWVALTKRDGAGVWKRCRSLWNRSIFSAPTGRPSSCGFFFETFSVSRTFHQFSPSIPRSRRRVWFL